MELAGGRGIGPDAFLLLASALLFGYLNGLTDSANIIAPVISCRAMSPRRARLMTAAAIAIAPFIFGVAVARTIGQGILPPHSVTSPVVAAAALSALGWSLLSWRTGIPSSASHALVGGLLGAGLAAGGRGAVQWPGIYRVLGALFFSPVVGLVASFLVTRLIYFLAQWATPKINSAFRFGQVVTALALSLSYGANDAQKIVGLLALGLSASTGRAFAIPPWVVAVSMASIVLGTLTSSWRLIRTLGGRFYRLRPVHGLATQAAAAGVIFGAAFLGGPVSATHVVSAAVLGAGAAERVNQVRWSVAANILWAWLLTIPATALAGAGLFWVIHAWM